MTAREATRRPFLPDFCEQGNLLRTMVIAQLLVFVLVAATPGDWSERMRSLAIMSLFIQWVAVVDIALLCALQSRLARFDDRVAALAAFGLLQLVTLSFTWIAHAIARLVYLPVGQGDLSILLFENGVISVIMSAIVLRYFYVTAQWRRDVEASAEAQVQALQARIRPHFLFNSMNTIASLTRSDPATAERAVEDLSELFRASLGRPGVVPLSEELDLVGSYLRIEDERLGERLVVEWNLDAEAGAVQVPALSLQPLVENAVYHGIEQCRAGGRIRIETRREDRNVVIVITNPLPAMPEPSSGYRIAQENVRQRLAFLYEGAARMDINAGDGDYRVTIRIPFTGGVKR